jgi:hypothetical protein
MRSIAIGLVSLALLGPAAAAEPATMAESGCVQAVKALQQEWQAIGYPLPSKQMRASITSVDGQHHASAAQVNNMRLELRLAGQECNQGNQAASLQHVAAVRGLIENPMAVPVKRAEQ